MNERIHKMANEAATYANRNSGNDRYQGHYWTTLFYEKYTQLLIEDLGTIVKGEMPSRLSYELVKSIYRV
jgi:hypothetical protein